MPLEDFRSMSESHESQVTVGGFWYYSESAAMLSDINTALEKRQPNAAPGPPSHKNSLMRNSLFGQANSPLWDPTSAGVTH